MGHHLYMETFMATLNLKRWFLRVAKIYNSLDLELKTPHWLDSHHSNLCEYTLDL